MKNNVKTGNDYMNIDKINELAINGLLTEEMDHKQWYLIRLLEELGVNIKDLREQIEKEGYDFDEGIAP